MRTTKIVADSSANLLALENVNFGTAPLKITTTQREFVDDSDLDLEEMIAFFDSYTDKSKTSCPNPADFLEAFGDADDVFCVTITSGLSGSYNAALAAKQLYEAEHIGSRVFVIDSLSAGPELALIIEKLRELMENGLEYEEICRQITEYTQKTGLVFALASLKNFAANGRVPMVVARVAGVLNIRIVGIASEKGTLQPLDKCRGENKCLEKILSHLQEAGLRQGKVRIAHCANEAAARKLAEMLRQTLPAVDVAITPCLGLCSYYAEKGGLLVGYEKF